ncbi:MAG: type II toxin-antitoxin system HicA family toxin [Deltaproteobacteria bacterium]|nr:type II toxin-antitoxin system HicA family toxin [Deltaproteobacteria bacterium]
MSSLPVSKLALIDIVKEKGPIRYYGKSGWNKLIRKDYHGSKEIPTGTCNAVLKAAGIKK